MAFKATAVTSKTRNHGKVLFLLRILQLLACITVRPLFPLSYLHQPIHIPMSPTNQPTNKTPKMLILFSIRLARLKRLTSHTPSSVGAVEGILAASVLYTLLATALSSTHSKLLSLVLLALDIAFVCGFIVVSVLTSPKHYTAAWACLGGGLTVNYHMRAFAYCSLPWGPFILGILST